MSKISFLQAAAILAVLALPGLAVAQGRDGASRVAVRVYDGAAFDEGTRAAAIQTAAAIVAETGVATTWLDCTGDSLLPRCRDARANRELIIRISPTFVPGTVA